MKILVLIFIVLIIIVGFRFFSLVNIKKDLNKEKEKKEKIVDLEKDPKTDEYKPKD